MLKKKLEIEQMGAFPNPYRAYDIETGKWFYHEDVIEKVKSEFQSSPPRKVIVIHGFIGSGKTSTLLRMADEPGILGPRYIAVYINASDTAAMDISAFLLVVYKAVKDVLSLLGHTVDKPDYSFSTGISTDEMISFIDSIGKHPDGNIILLIVDDFEKMQRKAGPRIMDGIFEFFDYILHKTGMFRLILAGKGDIFKLVRGTDMSYLLNRAFKIELGMFLERKKIENLVTGPVKGYIKYEAGAVQEIVRITGRNLYCQQLLCYYLVEYLNEKRQAVCSEDDVRQAVCRTISDKREDFVYFWDHLPYERKIVLAALADEGVLKKEGRFYFLKESALLDAVFHRETISELLEGLHKDQHINRIKGRRFDEGPFMIPLYGEWVKKSHSLVQTVVENWQDIIKNVSLSALGEIMAAIPAAKLPLDREIIKTAKKLSKKWSAIKTTLKMGKVDKNQVEKLVQLICDMLRIEMIEKPGIRPNVFTIDMNRLGLGGLENVPLFAVPRLEFTDTDVQHIQDEILAADRPATPSVVLCFKKNDQVLQLAQKPFLSIVLIEENDLKKCILSPVPAAVFRKDVLIRQIRPSVISPYKTEGPVRATFYGRGDEIGRILGERHRNFAIVGARKIGKSSLLFKVISELPPTTIPIYMDLETPENQNYAVFLSVLREKIKEKYHEDVDFNDDLSNFAAVIKQLSQTGKRPLFFLDEVDILLEFDEKNKYKLLAIFRSLAQERYCQVIISGFKKLYFAKRDINSPLYNFLEVITLDELRRNDAVTLISEPMASIGIKYADDEDKKRILQHTSCHPNLIQFFCKNLVERIQEKEDIKDRRTIFRRDIEELSQSFDYENYVINEFYLFFTGDIGPMERLIISLLLKNYPGKDIFPAGEIIKILKANGIRLDIGKLSGYLAELCLRYIFIAEAGGSFRFALPVFPGILSRYDLDNLIKEAKKDAKESL